MECKTSGVLLRTRNQSDVIRCSHTTSPGNHDTAAKDNSENGEHAGGAGDDGVTAQGCAAPKEGTGGCVGQEQDEPVEPEPAGRRA